MHALNPVQRIGDQIAEPILLHEPEDARRRGRHEVGELLEQVGLPGAPGAAPTRTSSPAGRSSA